jgi:hypothetical protein
VGTTFDVIAPPPGGAMAPAVDTIGGASPAGRLLRRLLVLAALVVGAWLLGTLLHGQQAQAAPVPNPPVANVAAPKLAAPPLSAPHLSLPQPAAPIVTGATAATVLEPAAAKIVAATDNVGSAAATTAHRVAHRTVRTVRMNPTVAKVGSSVTRTTTVVRHAPRTVDHTPASPASSAGAPTSADRPVTATARSTAVVNPRHLVPSTNFASGTGSFVGRDQPSAAPVLSSVGLTTHGEVVRLPAGPSTPPTPSTPLSPQPAGPSGSESAHDGPLADVPAHAEPSASPLVTAAVLAAPFVRQFAADDPSFSPD